MARYVQLFKMATT